MEQFVRAAAVMTLEQLTDEEEVAFHLFCELNPAADPKQNLAWPKVEPLFTQALAGGHFGMHELTLSAALDYLRQRSNEIAERAGD